MELRLLNTGRRFLLRPLAELVIEDEALIGLFSICIFYNYTRFFIE